MLLCTRQGRTTLTESSQTSSANEKPRPRWLEASLLALLLAALLVTLSVYGPFRDRPTPEVEGVTLQRDGGPVVRFSLAPMYATKARREELGLLLHSVDRLISIRSKLVALESTDVGVELVTKGQTDVAILPPLGCVQARERERSVRLLAVENTDGRAADTGLLVTRSADGLSSPGQLRGKRLCAVDPLSSSGYGMARLWLRNRGLDPDELFDDQRFTRTHAAALEALSRGECDVASVSETALAARGNGDDATALTTLARTGVVPFACWIASPSLNDQLARNIGQALTIINLDGPRITGFAQADSSTFRAVRIAAQLDGLLR
jgi:ABC-type phosphate/phosphonate transport system substrate-binding protein